MLGNGNYTAAIANSGALLVNTSSNQTFGGIISGNGSLTQAGNALTTLLGANSYTGSTTITTGTLAIGSTGVLGNGNYGGAVANSGALVVNTGSNQTFGGIISGGGALYQSGNAITTLLGANSYTGSTTITAGTLAVGGTGVLGNGNYAGTIANSGALLVNTSVNQTLGGVISGSGSLVQSGANLLTIGNTANTYSGGTTINGGTLATTNFANLGSGTISIGSAGTYLFTTNGGNQPTFSNAVSGSGAFNVVGSANNQSFWSGSFSAFSGTMTIGPAASLWAESNNLGSTAMTVVNNGQLGLYDKQSNLTATYNIGALSGNNSSAKIWGQPSTSNVITVSVGGLNTSTTYAGQIVNNYNNSGNGDTSSTIVLAKVGTGMLTLSGANYYTGGTTISAGTLAIGGSGYLGGGNYSGAISNSGAFVLNTSNNQTLGGAITGPGGLYQLGSNLTTLSTSSNYTGGTTISGGTLATTNNNSLGSSSGTTTLADVGSNNIKLTNSAGSLYQGALIVANSGTGSVVLEQTAQNAGFYENIVLNRPTTFQSNGNFAGGAYFGKWDNSGVISGTCGTLTVQALGTGLAYVAGNNSFAGTVLLPQGGVYTFNNSAFGGTNAGGVAGATNPVVMTGTSTLGLYGAGLTVGAITGASGNTINTAASGNNLLTLYTPNSATFAGVISGGGGLSMAGTGIQTLSGPVTYTGATAVSGGTLVIGSGALPTYASATTTVNRGAMLQWSVPTGSAAMVNGTNAYVGAGIAQKTGSGTLTYTGNGTNTISLSPSGVFDIQAGNVNWGGGHSLLGSNSGGLNIAAGATFHISDAAVQLDALTGSGSLNNAYNNSTPTITIGVAGDVNNAAYGVANNTATFSGVIGYPQTYNTVSVGTVNLVKQGSGVQVLSGSNGYTGSTTVSGGILRMGPGGSIAGSPLTTSGGIFDLNGQNETLPSLNGSSGSVTNSAAGTATTLTLNNGSSFYSGLLTSAGTLNVTVDYSSHQNTGAISNTSNNFVGTITVIGDGSTAGTDANGVLGINTDASLGNANNNIVLNNGGTLINGYTSGWNSHAAYTLGAGRTITMGTGVGGVLRVGWTDVCTINGVINGPGNFTKYDSGTLVLAGTNANTYAGTTYVTGGALVLSKTGAVAVPGNLVINGNGNGGANVWATANNQLSANTVVSNGNNTQWGCFTLLGTTQIIAGLSNTGGNLLVANDTTANPSTPSPANSGAGDPGFGRFW